MNTTTLRKKMQDYVHFASEEQLQELGQFIQKDLQEKSNLWENEDFVRELNERVAEYESGIAGIITWNDVQNVI